MPRNCIPFFIADSSTGRVFEISNILNNYSGGPCFQAQFNITEFYLGSPAWQKQSQKSFSSTAETISEIILQQPNEGKEAFKPETSSHFCATCSFVPGPIGSPEPTSSAHQIVKWQNFSKISHLLQYPRGTQRGLYRL